MKAILERLLCGEDLPEEAAADLMHQLAEGAVAPAQAGAVLAALRMKGETPEEIRGFARAMRALAKRPPISNDRPLVDTCGTGGDGSGSLNLSTGVALLLAGCGVDVVKHGNRSISSRSGSADVLETLGVPLGLSPERAAECLSATGFTFLFAPHYHPAMKAIMPVRRAMGVRTVFNMLGPLSNPARPPFQVVGAFSADAARRMAGALSGLGLTRAFVVHGARGWDEATPVGPFLRLDVRAGSVVEETIDPADLGLPRCSEADLAGGDAAYNAGRLRAALQGREDGPHRDALVLGAGLALEVSGVAADTRAGMVLARGAIDDGRAAGVLIALAAFDRPEA